MKKSQVLLIPIVTLILAGCGGGSDSDSSTKNYAYYIDSAVGGIHYSCGAFSDITDQDGKFYFEPGEDCTFSLAYTDDTGSEHTLILKTISADETNELTSGSDYQEDNQYIGQVLQSLNNDDDVDDGISIDQDSQAVKAFVDAALASDIDNVEEDIIDSEAVSSLDSALDDAAQAATDAGELMTKVSVEEAVTHLIDTIVHQTALIRVGYGESAIYSTFSVSDTDSITSYSDQLGSDELASDDSSYSAQGSTLTLTIETDSETVTETDTLGLVSDSEGYYLSMTDLNGNLIQERLYSVVDKGAAESYLVRTILTDATLYLVESDMAYPELWQVADASDIAFDVSQPTISYTDDGSEVEVTITDFAEDYLTYTYTTVEDGISEEGSGRAYYDSDKASDYLAELDPDSSTDPDGFTEAMVSGKTFYSSDFYKLVFSTNGTLQDYSMLNPDENVADDVDASYTIIDGVLAVGDEGDRTLVTLLSVTDDALYIQVTEEMWDETEMVYLYTSLSALENALLKSGLPASVTDSANDSTNDSHAGFELLTLAVKEVSDGEQIQITVTANGSIPEALATDAVHGEQYSNTLWITINDQIEFGLGADGNWCDVDDYSYQLSNEGKTLTLTLATSQIDKNDYGYLAVLAETAEDHNSSEDEEHDEYSYDLIWLVSKW